MKHVINISEETPAYGLSRKWYPETGLHGVIPRKVLIYMEFLDKLNSCHCRIMIVPLS